ncbi:hypothetical protein [Aliiroseovarius sp.]|nr:hypothetical protein [Aliiroseovarius sp.]
MKAMLTGFVAIAVIAVGANLILDNAGFAARDVQSGAAVRLD